MDVVITYVNGFDPLWQQAYRDTLHAPFNPKHFRDWGTLPYLLRGIERYLPYVENVHLVVSSQSQVPPWVNRQNLQIVTHSQIIPKEYLPVFNSAAIEVFLHKIPGLAEQFLYFNDDIFPVAPCPASLFYVDGKSALNFATCLCSNNLYKKQMRNSYRLAQQAAGKPAGRTFKRTQHCCTPMQRSVSEELFQKMEHELLATVSPVRTAANVCQAVYLDYYLATHRAVSRRLPSRFYSLAVHSAQTVAQHIRKPKSPLLCINDVNLSDATYHLYRSNLHEAFLERFPLLSKWEL